MSKLLNDWAEGRFDIEKPSLILSEYELSLEVQEGERYHSSLVVSSDSNDMIKGRLYCDCPCLRFVQNSFEAKHIELEYEVITEGLYRDDTISGNVRLYTNLDIVDLPISVKVIRPGITIGNITIYDLEEFALLLNENYALATEFFFHSDFESVVLYEKAYAKAAARLIKQGKYKKDALDRFSYALGLKDRSVLSFADMALSRVFAPKQTTKYSFELIRENSSHIDIFVECKEAFINLPKTLIEQRDFVGNKLLFHYFVDPSLLSEGLNEANIIFKNDLQEIRYRVLVDKAALTELEKRKLGKRRRYVLSLMNSYIDFRLGKIAKEEWAKKSLDYAESLEKLSQNVFVKLYQVHLLLALNDLDTARNLLYSLDLESETDVTNKAYFLYLVAFFKEDPDFAVRLTEDLHKYRSEREDLFSLLWFLLFLDDEYVGNISKRYRALKEQYALSGGNVILLCEAVLLLGKNPELLSEFTGFEIEVCNFALKRDCINGTLWNAIFHIAGFDRSFKNGVFRLLCAGYDKYMTSERLDSLSSYCVTGGCMSPAFLPIYEEAIMKGSNITQIYEYYLKSLPLDYDRPILKQALHYFKYKADMADEDRALLYANMMKFYKSDDIFKEYADTIKNFTLDMLLKKQIDENLVYLYNNVLTVEDINAINVNEMAFIGLLALVKVSFLKASALVVLDSRLKEALNVKLVNNMAVIPLCFDELCIAFEDEEGNLHLDNTYIEVLPLVQRPDLLQACKNYNPDCFEYKLWVNDFIGLLPGDNLEDDFRLLCNNEAAKYYNENPYDEGAFDYIEQVDDRLLNMQARAQVANLNIIYNRMNAAIRQMTAYGYYKMSRTELTNFCEALIKPDDAESIRTLVDDSWLIHLSAYLYHNGVRSPKIITLMSLSHEGNLEELLKLWESCGNLQIDRKALEERILQLSCYLRTVDERVLTIYESYTKGQINKKIALSYLSLLSFDYYILKNKRKNKKRLFFHVVNYYMNFKQLSGVCQMAALDYLAAGKELTEDDKEFVTEIIKEHIASGIYFDIFEAFNEVLTEKRIELSFKRQKHFVTHIDEAGKLILIKYRLLNKDGDPILVMQDFERGNMQEIYPCIYIKDFILFAGEAVEYIVVGFESEAEVELYAKSIKAGSRKIKQFNKDRYDMVEELLLYKSKEDIETCLRRISTLDAVNKELFLLR